MDGEPHLLYGDVADSAVGLPRRSSWRARSRVRNASDPNASRGSGPGLGRGPSAIVSKWPAVGTA